MKTRFFCHLAWALLPALILFCPAFTAAGTAIISWRAVQYDSSGQPTEQPIHYFVYRDTVPTFQPNSSNFLTATSDTFIIDEDSRLADPGRHLFYLVRSQDGWGNMSQNSNRAGEVPFTTTRVRLLLQAVYQPEADSMSCRLREADIFPFWAPHIESRRYVAVFSGSIVDWVLLQFLYPETGLVAASRAFLLRQNGSVVELDGANEWLGVPLAEPGMYRLRVKHRNHAAVTLSTAAYFGADTARLYNFANDSSFYAAAQQGCLLKEGCWGLKVGDLNDDQAIDDEDGLLWRHAAQVGAAGYQPADLNFDGQVTSRDYVVWYRNRNP